MLVSKEPQRASRESAYKCLCVRDTNHEEEIDDDNEWEDDDIELCLRYRDRALFHSN